MQRHVPYVLAAALSAHLFHGQTFAETQIEAVRATHEISLDPFDPVWQHIPTSHVPLMSQTLFVPRGGGATKEVVVQALYTKAALFLRLVWADSTKASAQEAHRTEGFDDAVAVQVPLHPEAGYPSPFMGDVSHPVTIWHWKASWQEALDVAQAHPRVVRDEERFAKDVTFRTGEAVGNPFSQPQRKTSVEHLIASGFGTLTTTTVQSVDGRGLWRDGRWSVVMRRLLVPQDAKVEVDLRGVTSVPIAFAVWDGAHQERDGMKSVSVWQTLVIEQRVSWWKRLRRSAFVTNHRQPTGGQVKSLMLTEQGKQVFARHGCAICHGPEGRGGIRNPNAATFEEVPALVSVAEGFTKDELKEKIRQGATPAKLDPAGPGPERSMPTWHSVLDDEELEALSEYLMSLLPEEAEQW